MNFTAHDPALLILLGLVILGYLALTGFLIWLLVTRSVTKPARLVLAVVALIGGLPPILYAVAQVMAA